MDNRVHWMNLQKPSRKSIPCDLSLTGMWRPLVFLSGTRETIPPAAATPKGHSDLRGRVLPRTVLVFLRGVVKLNQPLSLSLCRYVCVCIKSAILFSRLKAVRLLWLRMRVREGGVMSPREAGKRCDRYCHGRWSALRPSWWEFPPRTSNPKIHSLVHRVHQPVKFTHCCTYLYKGLLPPEFVSTLFVSQVRRHLLGNVSM